MRVFVVFISSLLVLICSTGPSLAQLVDDNQVFNSYLSDTPPVIDGIIDHGEWDMAGEPIVVLSNSVGGVDRPNAIGGSIPGDAYGGDEDFSYQFRSMWVAPWDIYFLVEVTDDIAMDDAHNLADRAWERDQIELFIDGDQLTGGNIQWWAEVDTGPQEKYGKFGVARTGEYEGNLAIMSDDPEEVGLDGISGAGIATETGENANYFVEYRISMRQAFEDGLFDGTDAAAFQTMVPEETAIKFQLSMSDNDNFGLETDTPPGTGAVRSHGSVPFRGGLDDAGCSQKQTLTGLVELCGEDQWWRSDAYPNLLLKDIYTPTPGLTCDFDGSGTCDIADLNELIYTGLSSGDAKYDLDASGSVDIEDRNTFLREIGSLPGDANLDGTVNAQDLNAIGSNWQQDSITSFANGDFNGDGTTDAGDLNEAGLFWTKTAADFAAAPSAAAVPEPNTLGLLGLGLTVLLGLRRRG